MNDENLRGNTKALQKEIKRAKLFAIQHLTRRIKMLKNKRGTEQQVQKNTRKAMRFGEELECIKDLDINVVLRKIENEDLSHSTIVGVQNVQERAIARLISSKPIQDNLKVPNNKNNACQGQKHTKSKDPLSDPKQSRATSTKKASSQLKTKQDNLHPASHILPLRPDSSSDNNSIASDNEVVLERTATSCFVQSLSSMKDQYTTRQKQKPAKQKENRSSSKFKIDEKPHKERQKSNRLGQRARQKLWKERYGKKAHHINLSEKTEKLKHDKKRKEITSNKSQKLTQQTKRELKGIKRKPNSRLEEPASHPSWEASKRRKLQQNITQTTFQGQKIIFEDSD